MNADTPGNNGPMMGDNGGGPHPVWVRPSRVSVKET